MHIRIQKNSRPRTARNRALTLTLAAAMVAAPLIVVVGAAAPAAALANGLALTPPMGFNDWNAYGCNTSESLIEQTALAMHNDGMQAAGYQYVNIDDCWLQSTRDANGNLQPDYTKFPDGISGTAAYVHSLGLKLGIYEDGGTATCAGYPGSLGHETQDANLFASWGVDYVKYDNCNNNNVDAQTRYTTMGNALKATGRSILFSLCDWGQSNVTAWGPSVGNMWRTTGDITDSFSGLLSNFHGNVGLAASAGPGGWNDPDMLETGNGGMTTAEYQAQFSLWSEMAAPLIDGSNLVSASATTLSILTNTKVIAVDQDSLGKQGVEVSSANGLDVMAKPLSNGDVAVVLFNENGSAATISTTAAAIGKSGTSSYSLSNLWTGATTTTTGTISASVPADSAVMYRVSGGTSAAPPAPAEIVGSQSGRCLDVPGGTQTDGTQVEIWDCNGGTNQEWTHTSGNALTVYSGAKCLDAYNNQTTPGTKVEIWDCNGATNQQWTLNSNGTITGVQSGLCLDASGQGTANGTLIELWTCNGQTNQKWTT